MVILNMTNIWCIRFFHTASTEKFNDFVHSHFAIIFVSSDLKALYKSVIIIIIIIIIIMVYINSKQVPLVLQAGRAMHCVRQYTIQYLRSSTSALLVIPFVRSNFASDAFSVSAPTLWNNLPQDVRSCANQATFKSRLKSHLFSLAFTV